MTILQREEVRINFDYFSAEIDALDDARDEDPILFRQDDYASEFQLFIDNNWFRVYYTLFAPSYILLNNEKLTKIGEYYIDDIIREHYPQH
jgi:hypothetical protein